MSSENQSQTLISDQITPPIAQEVPPEYWNYRLVRKQLGKDFLVGIHEVHYTNGVPSSVSKNMVEAPFIVEGQEPLEEIAMIWELMKKALSKPILDFDKIGTKDSQ